MSALETAVNALETIADQRIITRGMVEDGDEGFLQSQRQVHRIISYARDALSQIVEAQQAETRKIEKQAGSIYDQIHRLLDDYITHVDYFSGETADWYQANYEEALNLVRANKGMTDDDVHRVYEQLLAEAFHRRGNGKDQNNDTWTLIGKTRVSLKSAYTIRFKNSIEDAIYGNLTIVEMDIGNVGVTVKTVGGTELYVAVTDLVVVKE